MTIKSFIWVSVEENIFTQQKFNKKSTKRTRQKKLKLKTLHEYVNYNNRKNDNNLIA